MNTNQPAPFVQQLIHLYQASNLPAALTDDAFQILWSSQSAINLFPPLALPDGVLVMLQDHPLAQVRQEIEREGFFQLAGAPPFESGSAKICALAEAPGFLVLPGPAQPDQAGLQPEGLQRVFHSFESSHRTELSRIFSALNLMMQSCAEDAPDLKRIKSCLAAANNSAYRLLRSSEWILYHARLCSGSLPLQNGRVDIFLLLRTLCNTANVLLSPLGIPVEAHFTQKPLFISCDAHKFSLVLLNLISNSARYTRYGNRVSVTAVQKQEGLLLIKVKDGGLGIPPEVLPHVFEPYYSYNYNHSLFGSNGLGLTIAKEAVTLMGGTIAISSHKGGTTVTFTIPAIPAGSTTPPLFASTPSEYLSDRFSLPHVALSDCTDAPL